MDECLLL